jgi:hypothetical protein
MPLPHRRAVDRFGDRFRRPRRWCCDRSFAFYAPKTVKARRSLKTHIVVSLRISRCSGANETVVRSHLFPSFIGIHRAHHVFNAHLRGPPLPVLHNSQTETSSSSLVSYVPSQPPLPKNLAHLFHLIKRKSARYPHNQDS